MRSLNDDIEATDTEQPIELGERPRSPEELAILAHDVTAPLSRLEWLPGILNSRIVYRTNRARRKHIPLTKDGGFYVI